jgi:hypothetical protein
MAGTFLIRAIKAKFPNALLPRMPPRMAGWFRLVAQAQAARVQAGQLQAGQVQAADGLPP